MSLVRFKFKMAAQNGRQNRILNKNAVKWHLKQLLSESIIHREVVLGHKYKQLSANYIFNMFSKSKMASKMAANIKFIKLA